MKPSSSMPVSNPLLPATVRQFQWLLFSLLAFGFLASLPSQATISLAAGPDSADHLFAGQPYIVAANDLLRAVRSDNGKSSDDESGDLPLSLWLPGDIFQTEPLLIRIVRSAVSSLHSLPVSTLPGAPRGPPVAVL
jgi:hypothetical protein